MRGDGSFMIGNSTISNDNASNFAIMGKRYKGTLLLREISTRKNVNTSVITQVDIKKDKILEITNAHLEGYESNGSRM